MVGGRRNIQTRLGARIHFRLWLEAKALNIDPMALLFNTLKSLFFPINQGRVTELNPSLVLFQMKKVQWTSNSYQAPQHNVVTYLNYLSKYILWQSDFSWVNSYQTPNHFLILFFVGVVFYLFTNYFFKKYLLYTSNFHILGRFLLESI